MQVAFQRLSIAGITLIALSVHANAAYVKNDTYQVSQKTIPVTLKKGGSSEAGRLVYTAWVDKREEETGGPAEPAKGKFIDDRACNWQVFAGMTRQYYVNSFIGEDDPLPASTVPVSLTVNGASNGLASWFDHDPCTNYSGRISQDVDNLISAVSNLFDQRMREDIDNFKNELSGVTVEIRQ